MQKCIMRSPCQQLQAKSGIFEIELSHRIVVRNTKNPQSKTLLQQSRNFVIRGLAKSKKKISRNQHLIYVFYNSWYYMALIFSKFNVSGLPEYLISTQMSQKRAMPMQSNRLDPNLVLLGSEAQSIVSRSCNIKNNSDHCLTVPTFLQCPKYVQPFHATQWNQTCILGNHAGRPVTSWAWEFLFDFWKFLSSAKLWGDSNWGK